MSQAISLRAAAYCRTSGQGQRDNTSIPTQRDAIGRCCDVNGWTLVETYVDECKSGSKVNGRGEFQRLLQDAGENKFDVIVPFDIKRFSRSGADIIGHAQTLKSAFGVHVVDSKGHFDNRQSSNTLQNFVQAGVSEAERLAIMERTVSGRIARARQGRPWSGHAPVGRRYDKASRQWYVTERGHAIHELLKRYLNGESLTHLCPEFGFPCRARVSDWVWHGQLSGTYVVAFCIPDLGINLKVDVPQIPEVVPAKLLAKVRARLRHNRVHNRVDVRKYALTGFIRCESCGQALTGQTHNGSTYYRHKALDGCSIKGVRGDQVESGVLNYLYDQFLDAPAFNAAVNRALPSPAHRKSLMKQHRDCVRRLSKNSQQVQRLVEAVSNGADVGLLLSKQEQLKTEKQALADQLQRLERQIAALPSKQCARSAAMLTRIRLMQEHRGKDWRQLSHEDLKRFLFHLFGESTKQTSTGIFIRKDGRGKLVARMKGAIEFHHDVVDGRAISHALTREADSEYQSIRRRFKQAVRAADANHERRMRELKPCALNLDARSPLATTGMQVGFARADQETSLKPEGQRAPPVKHWSKHDWGELLQSGTERLRYGRSAVCFQAKDLRSVAACCSPRCGTS